MRMSDRSIDGIPSVKVNFADGSSDYLVLSKYENMDGHFIGHLAKENTACVAMVDHPEHAEITIVSDRTVESTMYKWKNNGEVELIPEVFSEGGKSIAMRNNEVDDEAIADEGEVEEELNIEGAMTAADAASVPATMHLQLKVGYDNSILGKLGSAAAVESYWNSAAPHLQARYCHASLGVKVRIERIGNFKHYAKTLNAGSDSIGLDSVKADTRNDIGDADLMPYMAAHQNIAGLRFITNGVAWVGTVCGLWSNFPELKSSINMWQSSAAAYGSLVAHEMGHNLGLLHDHSQKHGGSGNSAFQHGGTPGPCESQKHIMSYQSTREKWSTCSKADFEAHYLQVTKNWKMPWCMTGSIGNACGALPPAPAPAPTPPATGNTKCGSTPSCIPLSGSWTCTCSFSWANNQWCCTSTPL